MQKFRKSERLCSKKKIDELFSRGESLFLYPFRLVWVSSGQRNTDPVRIGVSVPARRIKKAVHRNRVKRLIRESYRLNRHIIHEGLQPEGRGFDIMVVYVATEVLDYNMISERFRELLHLFVQSNANNKEDI